MKSIETINNEITKDNIVDNLIKSNGIYCLTAWPKVGKSFLALQLANAITNEIPFLNFKANKSPVLYVSTELSSYQLKERITLTNYVFNDNSFFFCSKDELHQLNIKSDLLLEIKEFSEKYNGKLVIIDMIFGINYGFNIDPNSYIDISKIMDIYRNICKRYNITILLIHHLNKSGTTLGSIGIDGFVDGIFTLKDEKDNYFTLSSISRDFDNKEISLYRNNKMQFEVIEDDNTEIDYNLLLFLKYVIKKKEIVFTPAEIVSKLNIMISPTKFGKLLNSNIDRLKHEGIYVEQKRTSNARTYKATFIEPTNNP